MMLALAETLVTAFCQALGFDGPKRRPEVDVYELAERAGAEAKLEETLREDGRVEDSQLQTRIFLWSASGEARRRFTLGHELGHLVLADPRVFRLVRREFGGKRFQVEHLCDAFAAELLMPQKWLMWRYRDEDEGFDVVHDLTREAGVSLLAGFTRLVAVLRWRSSLLYLCRESRSLTAVSGPSRPTKVEVHSETPGKLLGFAASGRKSEPTTEDLSLRIEGRQHRLSCELRPTSKGIWLLAKLPRERNDENRHDRESRKPFWA